MIILNIKKYRFSKIVIATALALLISMPCCIATQDAPSELMPKTHIEKKSELKKVLKKFSKSMVLVASSGTFLWVALVLYKRFGASKINNSTTKNLSNELNTPETTDDAIKFIIEKF